MSHTSKLNKNISSQVLEQHNFYREKIKEKNLKAVKRKLDDDEKDDPNRLDADLDEMLRVKKSYCQEVVFYSRITMAIRTKSFEYLPSQDFF